MVLAWSSAICLALGVGLCLGSVYFFVDGLFETRGVIGCYDSCLGYAFGVILAVPGLCVSIVSSVLLANACCRIRRRNEEKDCGAGRLATRGDIAANA